MSAAPLHGDALELAPPARARQLSLVPEDPIAPAAPAAEEPAPDTPPPPPRKRRRRPRRQVDLWAEPVDPHPANRKRKRPISLGIGPLTKKEIAYREYLRWNPPVRKLPVVGSGCADVPRPCPYISCKKNLYTDRTPDGAVKLAFPHREPWQMPARKSCSIDVAEDHDKRKPKTFEEVGKLINYTMERTRQVQEDAFRKLRASPLGREWLENRLRDG